MINEAPEFPAFTDWVVKRGLLHEPMRIIDVGCQGGLHPRWKWLGDQLEAWAFDPLPDVIERLSAANAAPSRVRFFCLGLGNEDGTRMFSRDPNPSQSAFLPKAVPDAMIGRDPAGNLPSYWSYPTIRKLDSLMDERFFSGIDHLKMDCEGFEIEVVRGAERFLDKSGVFAVESESSLKLNPYYEPCHFIELYGLLGKRQFDVYDLYYYRDTRAPLPGGFPNKGRPDTFDFLFLRGFGADDDLKDYPADRLIKMMIVSELYGLQDVAADILQRASAALSQRLDTAMAFDLLKSSGANPMTEAAGLRRRRRFSSLMGLTFPMGL
jgi:FkbM family methyltransferase